MFKEKQFTRKQLVEYLAQSLDETGDTPLKDIAVIVELHSEAYCLKMLEDARKLHDANIRTQDNSRLRTLGGCFFMLEKFRIRGRI